MLIKTVVVRHYRCGILTEACVSIHLRDYQQTSTWMPNLWITLAARGKSEECIYCLEKLILNRKTAWATEGCLYRCKATHHQWQLCESCLGQSSGSYKRTTVWPMWRRLCRALRGMPGKRWDKSGDSCGEKWLGNRLRMLSRWSKGLLSKSWENARFLHAIQKSEQFEIYDLFLDIFI